MLQPDTKRLKRRLRKSSRQVTNFTDEASRQIDEHIFEKVDSSFNIAWRFIGSWLLLFLVLLGGVAIQARALGRYYLHPQPVAGGEYAEGMQGIFTNASPLFAASSTDTSVSRLVFSGLLRHDGAGKLTGDLAESWKVDSVGTTYTIKLRPDVRWHDGEKMTSADVVYTIRAIQNPDTRSPYSISWQGVRVSAPDERTVVMKLPNPLASFDHSLVQGIVPAHRLANVPFAQLRSNEFSNRLPVGTGPFRWGGVTVLSDEEDSYRQRIAFASNPNYHLGGTKLARYVIETFPNQLELKRALESGQINAASLASMNDISSEDLERFRQYSIPLNSGVYLFFNTQNAPLGDKTVRKGLTHSISTKELRGSLPFPTIGVDGPFLKSHSTYDKKRTQAKPNEAEAAKLFKRSGWVKPAESFLRQKGGKPLEFTLLTEDQADYARMADILQQQLSRVGVKLNVSVKSGRDFQQALLAHEYDALLYSISLGADPDVFAYWHSSQASQDRFNFSNYRSAAVDEALSSGRTRTDMALRSAKYRVFLDTWREDSPAVGIYQPRLLFVTNGQLYNFDINRAITLADRYANVHRWMFITEEAPLHSD